MPVPPNNCQYYQIISNVHGLCSISRHNCALLLKCTWTTGKRLDANASASCGTNLHLTSGRLADMCRPCIVPVLYNTVLLCTVLCISVMFCIVLYCTRNCIVLYSTVLYCVVLYWIGLNRYNMKRGAKTTIL